MALLCDVCLDQFDLDIHRPKSLPCGHTICCECVHNPAFGLKCPTCRKVLSTDPKSLPDNVLAIRLIGADGAPPPRIAAHKKEEAKMLQLQRGVDAGRKVVKVLRQVVPMAMVSLQRHLDSSVAQLRQMEEALEKMQQQATAGAGNSSAAEEGARDTVRHLQHLQQVAQLEDSLRLLTTNRCSIVAEEDEATWRTTVHLGPLDNILRLLLLQLRVDDQLEMVAADSAPTAAYAGPPKLSYLLSLDEGEEREIVENVQQNEWRWKMTRILRMENVSYYSEQLLRIVAPHLEELDITGAHPCHMEAVASMGSLRKLIVSFEVLLRFPDLPLHLEELYMQFPGENHLRCLQHMHRLRRLTVVDFRGRDVTFPVMQHGGLLWLGAKFHLSEKATMLSLIRAHASSLRELQLYCDVKQPEDPDYDFFFPNLGRDLAACALHGLRRLVLDRPGSCAPGDEACLLQRQTLQGFLPNSVDVLCVDCHTDIFGNEYYCLNNF